MMQQFAKVEFDTDRSRLRVITGWDYIALDVDTDVIDADVVARAAASAVRDAVATALGDHDRKVRGQ